MSKQSVPVVILAAGASRRFGGPKGMAKLAGKPLIRHVIDRIGPQAATCAVNCPPTSEYASVLPTIIPDVLGPDVGPLAGLHAAMSWAEDAGFTMVATVPIDTPFLPRDFISRLQTAGAPAIGESRGRAHPLCGLWPTEFASRLEAQIASGMRAAFAWADEVDATKVPFEGSPDPFLNINTNKALAEAEGLLAAEPQPQTGRDNP